MGMVLSHQQRLQAPFCLVSSAHVHPCARLDTTLLGHSTSHRERVWDFSSIPTGMSTLSKSFSMGPKCIFVEWGIWFYTAQSMVQMEDGA